MRPIQAQAEKASQLPKTLGNAQRLKMLCLLVEAEMTVGQINAHLPGLSQSALPQHLARLRDQGLARTQREAQTLWYARVEGLSQRIMLPLHDIYCGVWK